jgi:membrane protein involved in colicin uptake
MYLRMKKAAKMAADATAMDIVGVSSFGGNGSWRDSETAVQNSNGEGASWCI